ncbi:hypothetical protein [Mesorhizobium sp.]|uniref:hypothetical protein n=1 Tax=Mesorhizobium sp. TaxID=1871066 RepID=UPI0025C2D172|nr:hypothetical protein [Mesorhizobium sp.]
MASHVGEEDLVAGRRATPQSRDLTIAGTVAGKRNAHQVAQQLLAQRRIFRCVSLMDDQPGRGSSARVMDGKLDETRMRGPKPGRDGMIGETSLMALAFLSPM